MAAVSSRSAAAALGPFGRALRLVGRCELLVAVLALLAITGLTMAAIVVRYAFNASLVWSEEISLLLTNVLVFIGAAAMHMARADVALEFFVRRFPPRIQWPLALLAWFCSLALGTVIVFEAVALYPLQINTTSYILELPRFYATIPLIVGGASIAATSLYYCAVSWRGWRDGAVVQERESKTALLPPLETM